MHSVLFKNTLVFLIGGFFLSFPHSVFAADATNKDVGTLVGIPDGVLVTQEDQRLLFGGCPSDLWDYLKRHASDEADQGNGRSLVPRSGNPGIQAGLACRLYNFFKFLEQNSCKPKIISAFRSYDVQCRICGSCAGKKSGCAPAGGSCHQYGAAVDVSGCVDKMRSYLKSSSNQFKLHFPYSGPHIQCVEHKCAGASCCGKGNPPCGGGSAIDFDQIPQNQNEPPQGFSLPEADPTIYDGAGGDVASLADQIQQTDSGGANPGGASPSTSWMPEILQPFLGGDERTDQQNPFDTNQNDIFCSDEFGSTEAGCADPLARGLLGDELGLNGSEDEGVLLNGAADDSFAGGSGNDTLASAQACTDGVSRNNSACLQVRQQVPVVSGVGGASVQQTIQDTPTLSQRVFGTILSNQNNTDVQSDFNWGDGSFNNAVQYASFQYHRGADDARQLMYQDAYGQWRYRSNGAPVPSGLQTLVFGEDPQYATVPGISWASVKAVGSAITNAVLRTSFGVPIPFLNR